MDITPYLLVPAATLIVAQILKFAVEGFKDQIDFKNLLMKSGTPDSTSAVIISLIVAAYAVDGTSSIVFGVVIVFGLAILWNYYELQRKLAAQAKVINDIAPKADKTLDVDLEVESASVKDIGYGAIIGLVLGLGLTTEHWTENSSYIMERPPKEDAEKALIFFAVLLFLELVIHFAILRRKNLRKLPTARKLQRIMVFTIRWPALVGIGLAFLARERVGTLDQRVWSALVLFWLLVGAVWAYKTTYRNARKHLKDEAKHFKKDKKKAKKSTAKKKKSTKKTTRKK